MKQKIRQAAALFLISCVFATQTVRPIDDTATVAAAVATGTLAHGTYNISSQITLTHSLNCNGSTINYTSSTGKAFQINTNGVKLSNLNLVGPSDATNPSGALGIQITADHDTVTSVHVSQFPAYGILGGNANYQVITYNKVYDTGYIGMYFAPSVHITGCIAHHDTVDRSMISASQGTGVTQGAFQIRGTSTAASTKWTVHDLWLTMMSNPADWTAECYEHRYADSATIYNIHCTGGSIGISVVRNDYVRITNSTCTGQSLENLEYADSNYGYMGGNTLSGSLTDGILLDGGVGCVNDTIASNTIGTFAIYGIHFHTGVSSCLVTSSTITCSTANPAIDMQGADGITVINTDLTGASIGTYAFQCDGSIGDFNMTGGSITNFTSKIGYLYGAVTTDNINLRCVTTTGTTVGYNTGGGVTVGGTVNLSLPCYASASGLILPGGKLYIKH